jgi:hypothetical protein
MLGIWGGSSKTNKGMKKDSRVQGVKGSSGLKTLDPWTP